MGRKDLVEANNREIQNSYEGNYSIREIAQKIIDDSNYVDKVEHIIPVSVCNTGDQCCFRLLVRDKSKIYEGVALGEYGDLDYYYHVWNKKKDLLAQCDGLFIPNFEANFREYETRNSKILVLEMGYGSSIEIGKIYHNDYPFYIKNKDKIQKEISIIKKEKQEAVKIAKEQEKEEKQRKAKKLQDDIDKVKQPLMDLEKYILKHELPLTTTIDVIDQELSYVYNQKDSIEDFKHIEDYESRFENIYIEAKKNQNLDNITEGRMLNTLRTFFEIQGEPSNKIDKLISEIQNSGENEKFSALFKEQVVSMNNATSKLKSTFESEKKLDSAQLGTIENLSIYFIEHKDKIAQKKILEASKETLEYIWKEYSKIEGKSSTDEDTLKRTLKNIYETFGISVKQINEIFAKQTCEESERKFEIELNQIKQRVNESIIKLQSAIANREPVDFNLLNIIEESLSPLVVQTDKISDLNYFESFKSKIEAIYKECQKQKDVSGSVLNSILCVLDITYDVLGYTKNQKQKIYETWQKEDDERKFENELNQIKQKVNESIIILQNAIANRESVDFNQLNIIEESLSPLVEQTDKINDLSNFENFKSKIETIYEECHKQENISNSVLNSIIRVLDMLYNILGYNKNQKQKIYETWKKEDAERKFENELCQIKQKMNEPIIKLQNAIANNEPVDFSQISIIEESLSPLVEQKDKIKDLSYFDDSKSKVEAIYNECHKQKNISDSVKNSVLRVLDMLYDILNFSKNQKQKIYETWKKEDAERKFENELCQIKQKMNEPIIKLQNAIANNEPVDFSQISIIEESLSPLVEQRNKIKDLVYFESFKSKIDTVYDEYHKQDSVSDLISNSLLHILAMLYDILNYTDEQKLEILKSRQEADEERNFAKKIAAQKETIKNITSKIRELEILAENRGQPKTEVLQNIQCIEDLIKELLEQKGIIADKSELERDKIIFDAILKGSKKWKDFSKSSRLHMQGIADGFNELCGKVKNGFSWK